MRFVGVLVIALTVVGCGSVQPSDSQTASDDASRQSGMRSILTAKGKLIRAEKARDLFHAFKEAQAEQGIEPRFLTEDVKTRQLVQGVVRCDVKIGIGEPMRTSGWTCRMAAGEKVFHLKQDHADRVMAVFGHRLFETEGVATRTDAGHLGHQFDIYQQVSCVRLSSIVDPVLSYGCKVMQPGPGASL